MTAVEFKNVTFGYSDESNTLSNITFSIEKGTYVTLLGHNGSGKSTIAKLMVGLLSPNSGSIYIQDVELNSKNLKKIRGKIGLVFQNPDNQFIGATVEDDVAFGLENRCVPHEDIQSLVEKYVSQVGMKEYLTKEPSMLSGGQKQRIAIAGALALTPDIIIFDEATSMLDPKGKREVLSLIKEMKKENDNLTIISITHDVEEAAMSDEVIVLSHGSIELIGKPNEVFNNEEELARLKLETPFLISASKKFKKCGVNTTNVKDLDSLVEAICQSK